MLVKDSISTLTLNSDSRKEFATTETPRTGRSDCGDSDIATEFGISAKLNGDAAIAAHASTSSVTEVINPLATSNKAVDAINTIYYNDNNLETVVRYDGNYLIWSSVLLLLAIDGYALAQFIQFRYLDDSTTDTEISSYWFVMLLKVSGAITIFFSLNYLNYMCFHIFMQIRKLDIGFMTRSKRETVLRQNFKTHSGVAPDITHMKYFPFVTIQIPVYQEDLKSTIIPTIQEALYLAKEYNIAAGSIRCNIVVCDDGFNSGGLNKSPHDSRDIRMRYYEELQMTGMFGVCCRPHNLALTRNGRFKKAGNLNYFLNYGVALQNTSHETMHATTNNPATQQQEQQQKQKQQKQNPLIIEKGDILINYVNSLLSAGQETLGITRYELLRTFQRHLDRTVDEEIIERFDMQQYQKRRQASKWSVRLWKGCVEPLLTCSWISSCCRSFSGATTTDDRHLLPASAATSTTAGSATAGGASAGSAIRSDPTDRTSIKTAASTAAAEVTRFLSNHPKLSSEVKPWLQGNVHCGEYLLLIDKDTRLPRHQHALAKLISEFLTDKSFCQHLLFLQCHTGGFMNEANCIEKTTFTNVNYMYTGE